VTSLILATATRFLFPLLLMFSVFLLLRGHDLPGGGFIGGLIAASAFALWWIAFDLAAARRMLAVDPMKLIGAGLLLALASGWIGLLAGRPFLTGVWNKMDIPGGGTLPLGTPVLFDLGVYLVVLGVLTLIITTLAEVTDE
jgi:multicomponent Na+:H+ antiporter subunit B